MKNSRNYRGCYTKCTLTYTYTYSLHILTYIQKVHNLLYIYSFSITYLRKMLSDAVHIRCGVPE